MNLEKKSHEGFSSQRCRSPVFGWLIITILVEGVTFRDGFAARPSCLLSLLTEIEKEWD